MLDVSIHTPDRLVFQGKAESVIVPGEQGVFEALPYHKPLVSRLISGNIVIEQKSFPVRCGIIGIVRNRCTIVIEE